MEHPPRLTRLNFFNKWKCCASDDFIGISKSHQTWPQQIKFIAAPCTTQARNNFFVREKKIESFKFTVALKFFIFVHTARNSVDINIITVCGYFHSLVRSNIFGRLTDFFHHSVVMFGQAEESDAEESKLCVISCRQLKLLQFFHKQHCCCCRCRARALET